MRNLPTRYEDTALTPFISPIGSFGGLNRLQRAVGRLFDDFMAPTRFDWDRSQLLSPYGEFDETDREYLMTVDVPGVDMKDINVEVRGNQVMVSGERHSSRCERDRDERGERTERYCARFSESFTVPDNINPDAVKASCENGVLTIRVAKSEQAQARRIPIMESKAMPTTASDASDKTEKKKEKNKAA